MQTLTMPQIQSVSAAKSEQQSGLSEYSYVGGILGLIGGAAMGDLSQVYYLAPVEGYFVSALSGYLCGSGLGALVGLHKDLTTA